jgi:hypothetical protein
MNNAALITYILGILGGGLAALGWGQFDVATGAFTFNIYQAAPVVALLLAAVRNVAGWGRKR